jgi:hypothetical protein
MRIDSRAGRLVVAALVVVACVPVAAAVPRQLQALEADAGSSTEADRLHVSQQGPGRVSGWFEGRASVAFDARATSADRASASISVPGIELELAIDLRAGSATLGGRGQIAAADRELLAAFATTLIGRLGSATGKLGLHEHALAAAATILAEAPAGWQPSHDVAYAPQLGDEPGGASPTGVEACQMADQDGVDFLEGGCTLQTYDDICHDSQTICFSCETLLNGCDISLGCFGNCFAGCALEGRGWYTRDCAEHDRCCTMNANCNTPGVCLDEFRESLNDIIFGWMGLNCVEGCAP